MWQNGYIILFHLWTYLLQRGKRETKRRETKNHLQDVGQEREKFIRSLLSVFAFVKRFMKHREGSLDYTKLEIVCHYNLRFAENKIVPRHTFTGATRESVSGPTIKNIIKMLVKLHIALCERWNVQYRKVTKEMCVGRSNCN